jgi:DNA-binding PadR family transcriptional regulator
MIADKYGMTIAVLLEHFAFWYEKVKSEDHQFFYGDYWVRMKLETLHGYFTYLTVGQLRHVLRKMVEESLIKKSEFNYRANDRTKWYTLTTKGKKLLLIANDSLSVRDYTPSVIPDGLSVENYNSIYKEEDITKEDKYVGAMSFLMKTNPIEMDAWLMQNRKSISNFKGFLEYYEIVVQQEELDFTFNQLFGRLRKLRFNWKSTKKIRGHEQDIPTIKRQRIG